MLIDLQDPEHSARSQCFRGARAKLERASIGLAARIGGVMIGLGLLMFGMACAGGAAAAEETPQSLEQKVKAAFLFKFSGYVEWPQHAFPEPGSPLVIGVAGDDAFAEELERVVANRTMNGRAVVIHKVRSGDDLSKNHVLFVSGSQLARLGELAVHPRPVLAVSDVAKGLDLGSVINFVTAGNRVRFEVSLDAARRNDLKIGAPLLSVATRVEE